METSFQYLQPVVADDLIRCGKKGDGGYVLPNAILKEINFLLSFGVSYDWSFEKAVKEKCPNITIHAYDHTVSREVFFNSAMKELIKWVARKGTWMDWRKFAGIYSDYNLFFQKYAVHFQQRVSDRKYKDADITPAEIFLKIPQPSRILLKMDIENDEYRVLPLLKPFFKDIYCMIIEFHHTGPLREIFEKHIREILMYFKIVHLHGNNYSGTAIDNLPETLEVTFVKNHFLTGNEQFRESLPLPDLDTPNDSSLPDLSIIF